MFSHIWLVMVTSVLVDVVVFIMIMIVQQVDDNEY